MPSKGNVKPNRAMRGMIRDAGPTRKLSFCVHRCNPGAAVILSAAKNPSQANLSGIPTICLLEHQPCPPLPQPLCNERVQQRERVQERPPLRLQLRDLRRVLVEAAERFVTVPRVQEVFVVRRDPGDMRRQLVAEVRIVDPSTRPRRLPARTPTSAPPSPSSIRGRTARRSSPCSSGTRRPDARVAGRGSGCPGARSASGRTGWCPGRGAPSRPQRRRPRSCPASRRA